jgi:hypothetical protein
VVLDARRWLHASYIAADHLASQSGESIYSIREPYTSQM